MSIKKHYIYDPKQLPADWKDKIIILWEEDDPWPVDREKPDAAIKRISGRNHKEPIHSEDDEDSTYKVYTGGWVIIHTPERGMVGVLVK